MVRSVFIAGKDEDATNGLDKGFQNMGFEVEQANDGQEALEMLSGRICPTGILLSSALEGIKTLDLCKKLREIKKFRKTPIFVLAKNPVDRAAYEAVGVREIFEPPIYCSKIQQRLDAMLSGRKESARKQPNPKRQLTGVLVVLGLFLAAIVWLLFPRN